MIRTQAILPWVAVVFVGTYMWVADAMAEEQAEREVLDLPEYGPDTPSAVEVMQKTTSKKTHTSAAERKNKDSPRNRFNFIADVVEDVAPAVVNIENHARWVLGFFSLPNRAGF